jgi:hypothetical protein
MTGINSNTVYGLPHDRLVGVLRRCNRLQPQALEEGPDA